MMKRALVPGMMVVALILCVGCSEKESPTDVPAPETGNLEGKVYYGNWNQITDANVCVVSVGCSTSADRSWYGIEDIPAGNYMITALAPGFEYYQGSVRIYPDNENMFHIQLVPSSTD